jgi:hypothetical protein
MCCPTSSPHTHQPTNPTTLHPNPTNPPNTINQHNPPTQPLIPNTRPSGGLQGAARLCHGVQGAHRAPPADGRAGGGRRDPHGLRRLGRTCCCCMCIGVPVGMGHAWAERGKQARRVYVPACVRALLVDRLSLGGLGGLLGQWRECAPLWCRGCVPFFLGFELSPWFCLARDVGLGCGSCL